MAKQFLTNYLINKNKRFEKGSLNLIISHAGSGKSSFITGEKGLIRNTKQFYNEGIYKFFNFDQQKQKVLIITDNVMNRDVLTKKDCYQKFDYKDFYKAKNINCIDELVNNETGIINVMTYAKFLKLLTYRNTAKVVTESIDLIIMDEVHNLFDYSLKFDKDEDEIGYFTIIDNINTLSKNSLVIGLTATPQKIDQWMKTYSSDINLRYILDKYDLDNIISYTELEKRRYYSVDNAITDLCNNKVTDKVLIYTKKITTCKNYKTKLIEAGYKVEYLCADNKLNAEQQKLKQHLINYETLPKDLDILIINEAYQTGWNLKDDKVQMVIVNDSDETTITQARNRVRHDITTLIIKLQDVQADVFKTYDFNNTMSFVIDEEYLNRPLSTKEFNIVKDKYGTIRPIMNNEGEVHAYCSKSDFIDKDLVNNGYIYKDKMIIKANEEDNMYKELEEYLQSCIDNKIVFLTADDRQPLIEAIGIIDKKHSNTKDGIYKYVKNLNSLNGYLEEIDSNYRIKQFETSKIIDGKKKKFKNAWKVIKK